MVAALFVNILADHLGIVQMKYKLHNLATATLFATAALTSHHALADTATVSETGLASWLQMNLVLPVGNQLGQDYRVGSQSINVDSASFVAFCIDPFQYSSGTAATYNVFSGLSTLNDSQRATNIERLYSQSYASTINSNVNGAAFQLALWELANDTGSLSDGIVHTTATTLTQGTEVLSALIAANTMLGLVAGNTPLTGLPQYSFTVYKHQTQQDFLVSVTAVPEPETYALLLAGLGLVGWTVRRRGSASAKPSADESAPLQS